MLIPRRLDLHIPHKPSKSKAEEFMSIRHGERHQALAMFKNFKFFGAYRLGIPAGKQARLAGLM